MELTKQQLEAIKYKLGAEFMFNLNKLDEVYKKIEDIDKETTALFKKRQQLVEDSELMELLLMHRYNKENR